MIIGVTGRIGSGKSSVCQITKELLKNVTIFDIDKIVLQLYNNRKIKDKLINTFGTDKKSELKEMVTSIQFLDDIADIFLPYIKDELDRVYINDAAGYHDIHHILDAPLLFESELNYWCDITINIFSPKDIRFNRVYNRSDMSLDTFDIINASQLSDGSRNSKADYSLNNDKSLTILKKEIELILNEMNLK